MFKLNEIGISGLLTACIRVSEPQLAKTLFYLPVAPLENDSSPAKWIRIAVGR